MINKIPLYYKSTLYKYPDINPSMIFLNKQLYEIDNYKPDKLFEGVISLDAFHDMTQSEITIAIFVVYFNLTFYWRIVCLGYSFMQENTLFSLFSYVLLITAVIYPNSEPVKNAYDNFDYHGTKVFQKDEKETN